MNTKKVLLVAILLLGMLTVTGCGNVVETTVNDSLNAALAPTAEALDQYWREIGQVAQEQKNSLDGFVTGMQKTDAITQKLRVVRLKKDDKVNLLRKSSSDPRYVEVEVVSGKQAGKKGVMLLTAFPQGIDSKLD